MSTRLSFAVVVCLTFALPRLAASDDITFTVQGHGGFSGPVENFHDGAFWWADITPGVSSHTWDATGVNLVPPPRAGYEHVSVEGVGSTLLSSPIAVQEGEELSISLHVFAGMYVSFVADTIGFAVLLKDDYVHSVLAVVRPDGRVNCPIDTCISQELYPAPSANVVTVMTTVAGPHFTLGGKTYNDPTASTPSNTTCGGGPCLTLVTSTLTPGAGTYQLLAGAYNWAPSPNRNNMGVAVTEVTVPEPGTLALVGLGLAALGVRRLRRRRNAGALFSTGG